MGINKAFLALGRFCPAWFSELRILWVNFSGGRGWDAGRSRAPAVFHSRPAAVFLLLGGEQDACCLPQGATSDLLKDFSPRMLPDIQTSVLALLSIVLVLDWMEKT